MMKKKASEREAKVMENYKIMQEDREYKLEKTNERAQKAIQKIRNDQIRIEKESLKTYTQQTKDI